MTDSAVAVTHKEMLLQDCVADDQPRSEQKVREPG